VTSHGTEPVFAIDEQERGVAMTSRSAYGVVWAALKAGHTADERMRGVVSDTDRRDKELAGELVVVLHKLREFVAATGPTMEEAGLAAEVTVVAALADRLATAVTRRGATVLDPVGQRYADVADVVEVLGDDGSGAGTDELWITKTERAGMRWADGALVSPAQVRLGVSGGGDGER
jgi:hypothetical protein